jgi:hypothetical protein
MKSKKAVSGVDCLITNQNAITAIKSPNKITALILLIFITLIISIEIYLSKFAGETIGLFSAYIEARLVKYIVKSFKKPVVMSLSYRTCTPRA